MPALLIKDLTEDLHRKLREEAARNQRSMNRQVIAILEEKLSHPGPARIERPAQFGKPISGRWIDGIIRKARDSR